MRPVSTIPTFFLWLIQACQCLPERSLCTCLVPWFLWLLPRGCVSSLRDSGGGKAGICRSHRTVANKETILSQLSTQGSVQREQTEKAISLSFPERDLYKIFKSCCLRVQLPISLHLGADWDPLFWSTDRSWNTLNYCEPQRTKKVVWTTITFERQSRAWATPEQ